MSALKLAKQPMSQETGVMVISENKKNSHSFTTNAKQKKIVFDNYQQTGGIQKQGSVEKLRGGGRPKTNQSSRRAFGNGQVSLEQNIQENLESKNNSVTVSGNPMKGLRGVPTLSEFKRAHQNSMQQLQSIIPDSPIFRRNQVGQLDSLFGMSAYQQLV